MCSVLLSMNSSHLNSEVPLICLAAECVAIMPADRRRAQVTRAHPECEILWLRVV
jgi:hypothetical protein